MLDYPKNKIIVFVLFIGMCAAAFFCPGSFGFAQGSLFGYDASLGGYIRIDPSNGAVSALFPGSLKPGTLKFAYKSSGGAFYSFDERSRRVTRYNQWW